MHKCAKYKQHLLFGKLVLAILIKIKKAVWICRKFEWLYFTPV